MVKSRLPIIVEQEGTEYLEIPADVFVLVDPAAPGSLFDLLLELANFLFTLFLMSLPVGLIAGFGYLCWIIWKRRKTHDDSHPHQLHK